jgi:hypothetical protein
MARQWIERRWFNQGSVFQAKRRLVPRANEAVVVNAALLQRGARVRTMRGERLDRGAVAHDHDILTAATNLGDGPVAEFRKPPDLLHEDGMRQLANRFPRVAKAMPRLEPYAIDRVRN